MLKIYVLFYKWEKEIYIYFFLFNVKNSFYCLEFRENEILIILF